MTSELLRLLRGFVKGEDLKSSKFMKRRLTVQFERREASVTNEAAETKSRTVHGRSGELWISAIDIFHRSSVRK